VADEVTFTPPEDLPFLEPRKMSGHVPASLPATGLCIFTADVPCILQDFSIRAEVAAGTACRMYLVKVAAGVAFTSGTSVIGTGDGTAGLGAYLDMNVTAPFTKEVKDGGTYKFDRRAGFLAAGESLAILFTNGSSSPIALPAASLAPNWTLLVTRQE